jgi:hypothetical protein
MLIIMTMLILIIFSHHHDHEYHCDHHLLFLSCMLTKHNIYVDMNTTERVIEVLTKRNIKWRKAIVDVDDNTNNYDDDDSGNDKKHDVDNNHHTHDNNYNNQAKNKYKFQTATQIAATANKDNDICLAALSGITCYEDVEKLQSLGQTYILESSLLLSFLSASPLSSASISPSLSPSSLSSSSSSSL